MVLEVSMFIMDTISIENTLLYDPGYILLERVDLEIMISVERVQD